MFNSQMKQHDVYTISISQNEWNEEIKSPVFFKSIRMFISIRTYNNYTTNDIKMQEVTHIGITPDKTLVNGMKIDNQYEIVFINNDGKDSIVYLKQVI